MRRRILTQAIYVLLACLLFIAWTSPADAALRKCTICHGKPNFKKVLASGQVVKLFVDEEVLADSAHKDKKCVHCHADVAEIPHREQPKTVNCTRCHYRGNVAGAPQKVDYDAYRRSIHGRLSAKGDPKAPPCQGCHGNHQVFASEDPRSKIARANLPKNCGTCHLDIFNEYIESVHGHPVKEGRILETAVCTDCHGEHEILKHEDPKSKVFTTHVAETCSRCHGALPLMRKYGIEVEQVATYEESFHGIASKFGSRTVANCASCHGVHDIRGPNDPKSSVNIANIPSTCGKCHKGSTWTPRSVAPGSSTGWPSSSSG
jgi:DnaJ-class molecular chaperone